MNESIVKLLKDNCYNGISFYIGSTYMSKNWYILPFISDDLLRVVSLDSNRIGCLTDPATVVTDSTFTPDGICPFPITHFRVDQVVGLTIFSR